MQLCREASYESAQEIIRLGRESDDERVRYMANTWVYERAWGKAKEYDPKVEEPTRLAFDPSKLSPEQLAQAKQVLLMLMATAMTTKPAEGRADHQ